MASRSDTRTVVRRALACPHGWRLQGTDGRGHPRMALPDGRTVAWSSSPSDVNEARNLADAIRRACGCQLWARGGSRPGRGAASGTDYSTEAAQRDQQRAHQGFRQGVVDALEAHLRQLTGLHPVRDEYLVRQLASEATALARRAGIPADVVADAVARRAPLPLWTVRGAAS